MTLDAWLSLLHVLLGVLVVGPLAVLPLAGAGEVRARNASNVRMLALATRAFAGLAVVVAALGFAIIPSVTGLTLETRWLGLSVLAYVVAVALVIAVTTPALDRASARLTAGTAAGTRAITVSAMAVLVLMTVVVVLMMWQPTL